MFVRVEKLLDEDQLGKLDDFIARGEFIDGAATAGKPTRAGKNNRQLNLAAHPERGEIVSLLDRVMQTHPLVRIAAYPRRMAEPIISRYSEGMGYSWHIDNPVMQGANALLRCDIACTLFLSPRESYSGGELEIATTSGNVSVKLDRGDAILYPAGSRHRVREVAAGERLALVLWLQSMVPDSGQREILYELELAYSKLKNQDIGADALANLQRAQANLLRRWSEV